MRNFIVTAFIFISAIGFAQFSFSGFVNPENNNNSVYLSIVDDYRKLTGIYSEQIIARTTTDEYGFFEFKGNMLDAENRIYRIHVDNCLPNQESFEHFNGSCGNSETIIFIANNSDTLKLPFSFGQQIFCKVESNNPKSNAMIKIDSLKDDMRFAYSEFRSQANRKLNDKKWFKTLQEFGETLDEPLAELYIYAFLSDRSGELHNYYVEDLKSNSYYEALKNRLIETYPNLSHTKQYVSELESDRYMISISNGLEKTKWTTILYILLISSILLNAILLFRFWKQKKKTSQDLKEKLSKQEQVVLDHLLQNKSNKAIAEALFLSVSTVKSHTNNIYKKLNVQSRDDVKSLFSK